jgi:branched-chain amino acid transport system ATP-binding protein
MLLEIVDLHVKYGNIEVLHGIDLEVREGEIVTILGANGAGKSTTLLSISGLVKPSSGGIYLDKEPLHKLPAHDIVRQGIAQVPEGRRMFGTLTVQENIDLGAYVCKDKAQVKRNRERVYELFPILAERHHQLAGTLSGGEQQMLAIGRGLMSQPKVLLLDEPSLGLAPLLVKMIFQTLREINNSGVTILLVEQNARAALKLAHRGYVMEVGTIVLEDSSASLVANPEVQSAYLGGGDGVAQESV